MSDTSVSSTRAPKASIVVPSRGGTTRLPVLLDALRRQTETSFEVVVVLDGDIDDSRGVLEAEAVKGDLDIVIVEFSENRGRTAALNEGFATARGAVYVRCDDDFEPKADYVERHVAGHGDGPRGVIGVAQNVFGEHADTAYARLYAKDADERFHETAYTTPPESTWKFWAGNVSIDAETYAKIGPYDADYRAYGWEDVDWGYRLHAAGVPIVVDPALTTPHHLAAVTTQIRARRAYQSAAARHLFEKKHPEAMADYYLPWSPWNLAVRAVAALPPKVTLKAAAAVDDVLPKVPTSVGGKLVALVVEGCALGGRWRPGHQDLGI